MTQQQKRKQIPQNIRQLYITVEDLNLCRNLFARLKKTKRQVLMLHSIAACDNCGQQAVCVQYDRG